MWTFNFHTAYQSNRENDRNSSRSALSRRETRVVRVRAGESQAQMVNRVSDPGFAALLDGSGMGFITHPGLKLRFRLFRLAGCLAPNSAHHILRRLLTCSLDHSAGEVCLPFHSARTCPRVAGSGL